jgi:ABC-2 type transport system ATP-binding protein
MASAVVIQELVKTYPGKGKAPAVEAVRGITLAVEEGEFFGILGPNGAGKTTTVGCITTLVRPTSWRILVHGRDVARDQRGVKRLIAVVPQARNLDGELRVREILTYHGRYFGLPAKEREDRADRLLARMGLTDKAKAEPNSLSGGMQQRLMIARALMHDPKVLLLDEPTTGLDPQARRSLWELVKELQKGGLTVILTTHNMEEADHLCQRIAIIDHGKIVMVDSPTVLRRQLSGQRVMDVWVRSSTPIAGILSALAGVLRVERLKEDGATNLECVRLFLDGTDGPVNGILQAMGERGAELHHVSLTSPSLEDVYIHVTGKELR